MMKLICIFIFFLSTLCTIAQTVVLEKPQIPSPVKKVLFLSDINNINNYKGNITSVFKTKTTYNKDKLIKTLDTITITHIKQNTALKQQLKAKKVIDKIGIDSVAQKSNNTYELYKFDNEAKYMWQQFTLKNNQIIAYLDNGAVTYINKKFEYDKNNRLVKYYNISEYGTDDYVVKIRYTKDGKVKCTKKVDNSDGTIVEITDYNYKNDKLFTICKIYAHYFFNQTDLEIPVEDIVSYKKYETEDTYKKIEEIAFVYNIHKQLSKVIKYNKEFSKKDGVHSEKTQRFTLTHQPNKLIINVDLPQKKQYEYIFDAHQNPIEINGFEFVNNKKVLEEKTTLKIKYK